MNKSTQVILIVGGFVVSLFSLLVFLPIINVTNCEVLERLRPGEEVITRSIPCEKKLSVASNLYQKWKFDQEKSKLNY